MTKLTVSVLPKKTKGNPRFFWNPANKPRQHYFHSCDDLFQPEAPGGSAGMNYPWRTHAVMEPTASCSQNASIFGTYAFTYSASGLAAQAECISSGPADLCLSTTVSSHSTSSSFAFNKPSAGLLEDPGNDSCCYWRTLFNNERILASFSLRYAYVLLEIPRFSRVALYDCMYPQNLLGFIFAFWANLCSNSK